MLKLILRLSSLLSSLLFLDQCIGILGLVDAGIARLGLHTLQLRVLPVFLRAALVLAICRSLEILALRLSSF